VLATVGRSPLLGAPPEPPELPPLMPVVLGSGPRGAEVWVTGAVVWLTAVVSVGRGPPLGAPPEPPALPPPPALATGWLLGAELWVTGAVVWVTALPTGAVAWGALAGLSDLVVGAEVWATGAVVWLTVLVTGAAAWGTLAGLSRPSADADELQVPSPASAIITGAADLASVDGTTRNPFGLKGLRAFAAFIARVTASKCTTHATLCALVPG
jgi:hypothetical protein